MWRGYPIKHIISHVLTVLASILLFGAGGVMLYYHSTTTDHTNANGYIMDNSDCTRICMASSVCSGSGFVQVMYQLYNDTDIWYNGTSPTPLFCGSTCCDTYIHDNITVYFYVHDGDVIYTLNTPYYSSGALIVLGIIALVLGCMCTCVSVARWQPRTHHYTIINP
jgi:hypothetical protein